MRSVILLLAIAASATGQITELISTDDGKQVYFVSSVTPRVDAVTPGTNIYRLNEGRIERFAAPPESLHSNIHPALSGGGQTVAYLDSMPCIGGSSCFLGAAPSSFISQIRFAGRADVMTLPGNVEISRNGRYLVQWGTAKTGSPPGLPAPEYHRKLHDLATGEVFETGVTPSSERQTVTSDGRVLGIRDGQLVLWSQDAVSAVPVSGPVAKAIVNDRGTQVVYLRGAAAQESSELRVFDLSRRLEMLVEDASSKPTAPVISNDGKEILYVMGATTLVLARSDGSGKRVLADFPDQIASATLAGFGAMAFVSTGSGRILQVDLNSDVVTELCGPAPQFRVRLLQSDGVVSPGSRAEISGSGLASKTEPASGTWPLELAGVRVRLGGIPLPVGYVSPTSVLAMVPESFPQREGTVVLEFNLSEPTNNPFAQESLEVSIASRKPEFATWETGSNMFGAMILVHDDFLHVATQENPPRPGEVIHTYMLGLGETQSPPGPGEPAAGASRTVRSMRCAQIPDGDGPEIPIQVLYSGLAPGLVGYYQLDFRMPAEFAYRFFILECGLEGGDSPAARGFFQLR